MREKNRLWALPSNTETTDLQKNYEHFYCDNDHCLIISQEAPNGAVEVSDRLRKLLTASDWEWIFNESEKIRNRELEKISVKFEKNMKEFSEKFLEELKKMKESGHDGQCNTDSGDGSSS